MEIWNSKKALDIYFHKKENIKKESKCYSCDLFNECHLNGAKCWREVIKVYGNENWDYPDPRCPFSPEPINEIHLL